MIASVFGAGCKRHLIAVVAFLAMLGVPTLRSEETRLPTPSEEAQKKAFKLLKDVYTPYPPKTPDARLELSKKLIAEAQASKDDAGAQYVLLREAANLSASAGDFDAAMHTWDELAKRFAVDARAIKLASLKSVRTSRMSAYAADSASSAAVSIGWEAMRCGDFPLASQAASLAESFASEAGDNNASAASKALSIDAGRVAQESKHVAAAAEKLRTNPEDPSANRAVGRFLCLWQGRWDSGLPLLKKSDDPLFKTVAAADAAFPATATGQFAVAEQWYALSVKETGFIHSRICERATYWYNRAMPGLNGLQQTLAKRRLAEIDQNDTSNPSSNSPEAVLTRQLNDPNQWTRQEGKWHLEFGKLRGEGATDISFAQDLPADFVLSFRINVVSGMRPRIFFDPTGLMYGNEGFTKELSPHGATVAAGGRFPYSNNQPHLLRFTISPGKYEVDVDGRPAATGRCNVASAIKLRLRAGDDYSPGTTEFWDFHVESTTPPAKQ